MYKIDYEILDYHKYNQRLNRIINNPSNRFKVVKQKSLGKTKCGFDIEHYSIGNGPMHVVYMGGAHGNEIISVDFITQMMNNLALGNGEYSEFDEDLFTIDFIPCQNPEGYFTTTYALNSIMKGMSEEEIESFSKKYYEAYKNDDLNVKLLNRIIIDFCTHFKIDSLKESLIEIFWMLFRNRDITLSRLIGFLDEYTNVNFFEIESFIEEKWRKYFKDRVISREKKHHKMFENVTFDCIPEIDEKHLKLKKSLIRLYQNGDFPIGMLANFYANSNGVNLNDNNESYFEILKSRTQSEGELFFDLRENNISRNIPSPIGVPCANEEKFEYEPENLVLFDFLQSIDCYAFINCHGTGGSIYLYPIETKENSNDFKFYINNRLASAYTAKTGEVYERKTGVYSPYEMMGYPSYSSIIGVGDLLREKYLASFLLELSKMGGNPIGPYGDRTGNYNFTMEANMDASVRLLKTITELKHLYGAHYEMSYDTKGRVVYHEKAKKLLYKCK